MEVWRLYAGMWHSQNFELEPGDVIGGQASVELIAEREIDVDLRSPYALIDIIADDDAPAAGQRATRAHYEHLHTGRTGTRDLEQDDDNLDRLRLDNEAALRRQLLHTAEQ